MWNNVISRTGDNYRSDGYDEGLAENNAHTGFKNFKPRKHYYVVVGHLIGPHLLEKVKYLERYHPKLSANR